MNIYQHFYRVAERANPNHTYGILAATARAEIKRWYDNAELLYIQVREKHGHRETMARLMALAPNVADWLSEYEEDFSHTWDSLTGSVRRHDDYPASHVRY